MQVVEITDPGYHLRVSRGFLEVLNKGEQLGRVVLDDIEAVIISVPGCSITTTLIDRLAANNIPLVVSGHNYLPTSIVLALVGKDQQMQSILAQSNLAQPKRKRLWQAIVKAKIANQAALLDYLGIDTKPLQRLCAKVKSGDIENCEAQAARFYWPKIMGHDFRRDRQEIGINSSLNYCYAIIRASMARAVVAAGLHPTFSLHHKGPRNPLNLVDDLMEPFRPIADWLVYLNQTKDELQPTDKAKLSAVLKIPVRIDGCYSPVNRACLHFARSLNRVLLNEQSHLDLPSIVSPLEMSAV